MVRIALVAVVLLAASTANAQIVKKPQVPSPEPLTREAFMPAGDVLLSYRMDAKLDGKDIWLWKYHKRKLADLSVTNAEGKELTEDQVRKALKKPSIVLLSSDGNPVAPYYLKVVKPDTLVIIDRTPGADPTDRPRLGGLKTKGKSQSKSDIDSQRQAPTVRRSIERSAIGNASVLKTAAKQNRKSPTK